jgi:hypothetical protein
MAFKLATKRTANTTAVRNTDEDEYAGLWINVGVVTEVEGEGESSMKFNRLPRGIAVSDLVPHRLYANSHERNPEWAEEAVLVNAIIDKIREAGLKLKEGEAIPLNFSVQLYRRQEQVASVNTPEISVDLDSLFG